MRVRFLWCFYAGGLFDHPARMRGIMAGNPMDALSFAQISRILELTDSLGLNREWVEIPLAPERPGLVRRLPNGKLEIIVDADRPCEEWLGTLPTQIQSAQGM